MWGIAVRERDPRNPSERAAPSQSTSMLPVHGVLTQKLKVGMEDPEIKFEALNTTDSKCIKKKKRLGILSKMPNLFLTCSY